MYYSCADKINFTNTSASSVLMTKVVGINTGSGGGSGGSSIWTDVDGDAVLETDGKKLTIDANVGELGLKSRITTDASILELKAGSGGIPDVTIADSGLATVADMTVNGVRVGMGGGAYALPENTALGLDVLAANVSGSGNTGIGSNALRFNTAGASNTAVGLNAVNKDNGGRNTGVGSNALGACTGTGNTSIGESAGSATITGNNNTLLGSGAQPSSADVSNEVTIGNGSVTSTRLQGVVKVKRNNYDINLNPDSNQTGTEAVIESNLPLRIPQALTLSDNLTINTGELLVPDMDTTVQSPNLYIDGKGQFYKSTTAFYSADDVDKKLAIKDKLIEKLSARLDELELKFKALK